MSTTESRFIKWFGGIAATLLIGLTIWTFTILSSFDVMATKVQHNTNDIVDIKSAHKEDKKDLKDDLTEIKNDIKELLKK